MKNFHSEKNRVLEFLLLRLHTFQNLERFTELFQIRVDDPQQIPGSAVVVRFQDFLQMRYGLPVIAKTDIEFAQSQGELNRRVAVLRNKAEFDDRLLFPVQAEQRLDEQKTGLFL